MWEFVAGLGILLRVEDGLELVLWRRLYVVGIALLHRLTLADEELARVGRPIDAVAVVVADGAIVGELMLLAVGTRRGAGLVPRRPPSSGAAAGGRESCLPYPLP